MPSRYLHDLISGAEMDLTIQNYPTFERLKEYCYRVAGTVGLTCTHVFGFRDSHALGSRRKTGPGVSAHQHHSRCARRSTNWAACIFRKKIWRVTGCARATFGLREVTLGVRELLRFEAERAWQFYAEGARVAEPDRRGQPRHVVAADAHTYSALLARIEERRFQRVR